MNSNDKQYIFYKGNNNRLLTNLRNSVALLFILFSYSPTILAENYVGIYLGQGQADSELFNYGIGPVTSNSDSSGKICYVFICGTLISEPSNAPERDFDLQLDDYTSFGMRFGRWLQNYNWFGLSLDLNMMELQGSTSQTVIYNADVTNLSIFADVRFGFAEKGIYEGGRYQVYAGIQLLSFLTTDVELSSKDGAIKSSSFKDTVSFGPDSENYKVGVLYYINENLSTFLEYRNNQIELDLGVGSTKSSITEFTFVDAVQNLEQVVLGIQYRF